MLFPSKKHADVTRAFASGFRGRKDGREDPLGEARRPLPGRRGDWTAATAAARAGGAGKEGGRTGNGKEGMRKDWACKKGRGGGGRK